MTRFLVVNADDFGRSRGVSAGIVEAHLHGLVSTTTALMNLPGAGLDVAQAVREVPSLGLGVHLDLTLGRPVSPPAAVPTLISEDGGFWPPDALAARCANVDPEQVRREWRAQVEAFLARHVDARQETISLPGAESGQLIPDGDHDGFFYARLVKT